MLRGVFLISMFLISTLLIITVLIALMDTIFRPAAMLARCWGRPLIEDDVAAIEKVRQHYQNDDAITRLIDENAPLKLHSSYKSGWKKFVSLNHGKGYWMIGPEGASSNFLDGTFPIASVRGVIFESAPHKGDAFGLSCSVLACGDVFDCKTHN
ncbi:MAG: hypothetical protein B7Y08_19295 [Rhodospirillales bacterium 24-66-33]|jgi:hypothetical protein|nr:MAG: hypothetical protein B7Y57_19690 [Rhodospirillales bacterium 35-66-84]OYZ92953.1 MAG: hypothetical protein B7Y08_19295 [Rhodospirillales bacterium 24-66-33]OZB24392.1 MAG: hypothetical protein B7X63_15965 [Rhodospirillales bacterium 39-66-50]